MSTLSHTSRDRVGKIGSSDLAAILGANPYCTPYQAWLRITGREEMRPNLHTQRGHALEPGIADLYSIQNGVELDNVGQLAHPQRPWLIATPDRIATAMDAGYRQWVVEIKAPASLRAWVHGVPQLYQVQVLHQLELCRANGIPVEFGEVAALCGTLRCYRLERDPEVVADWWERAALWHEEHVLADVPPQQDQEPEPLPPGTIEASPATAEMLERYRSLRAKVKELELEKEMVANELREAFGDAEVLAIGGRMVASWKTVEMSRLDSAAVKTIYPEVAQRCTVKTSTKRLYVHDGE
jgi:putative phage-type endonuclease